MPNWVTNQVKIIADEVTLAKIREEVKGSTYENDECREFDFNTILPIPKELEGTQAPLKIISQEEYDKQEERIVKGELTDSEKRFGVSRGLTQELADEYEQRFGYTNWYDWQCSNWGTKWNANDVYWGDDNEYVSFNTAWSTPFDLFVSLSKKYPQATFEIEYADEDFGYNVGQYTLENGIEIQQNVPNGGSREAYELAMIIHYGGVDDYFDCNYDSLFVELYDEEEDELSSYINDMIEIAYDNKFYPFEDCNFHRLVLNRFKKLALANENFELVIIIDKELSKVEN